MTTQSGAVTHVAGQTEVRRESNRIGNEVKAILVVALAVAGGTAGAQEAGVSGIEEIVVTATRREQSFRDVPMAVSALDSQRFARYRRHRVSGTGRPGALFRG